MTPNGISIRIQLGAWYDAYYQQEHRTKEIDDHRTLRDQAFGQGQSHEVCEGRWRGDQFRTRQDAQDLLRSRAQRRRALFGDHQLFHQQKRKNEPVRRHRGPSLLPRHQRSAEQGCLTDQDELDQFEQLTLLDILMLAAGLEMIENNIDEDEFMAAVISIFARDEAPLVNSITKMAG